MSEQDNVYLKQFLLCRSKTFFYMLTNIISSFKQRNEENTMYKNTTFIMHFTFALILHWTARNHVFLVIDHEGSLYCIHNPKNRTLHVCGSIDGFNLLWPWKNFASWISEFFAKKPQPLYCVNHAENFVPRNWKF